MAQRRLTVAGTLDHVDAGSGPALLLVHGAAASAGIWQPTVDALSQNYRVIAPSLPGCGASPRLAHRPADLTPYADSLAHLIQSLGAGPVVVVGHSLGGLVCLRLARDHPGLVSDVVLVDSGGAAMGRVRVAFIVRALTATAALVRRPGFVHAVLSRPRLRRRLLARAVYDTELLEPAVLVGLLRDAAAPGIADAVAAGAREQASSPGAVGLAQPLTVIWGRNDRVLPVRLGVRLAGQVPGAVLEVIDHAGHAPMLDQPVAFGAAVRRAMTRAMAAVEGHRPGQT